MPTTTPEKIVIPAPDDAYALVADLRRMMGSARTVVPVANTDDRAARVSALIAAGTPPTPARPLLVDRQDAGVGQEIEVTHDGTTWNTLPGLKDGSLPYLHIRRGINVQARAGGQWGLIVYDQEVESDGHQPWTWSPGSPVTVTEDGIYAIHLAVTMTIATFAARIRGGGTGGAKVLAQTPLGTSGVLVANTCSATARLVAGDAIAGDVYPSATANISVDSTSGPSFMTVTRLSA